MDDLKLIKKHYGEKMMHLCRELFPTLLETGGLLSKLFPILFKGRSFCVLKDEIVSIGSDVILVESNCIKNKKTDMNF